MREKNRDICRGSKRGPAGATACPVPVGCEPLERRTLLSALVISGTPGNDSITLGVTPAGKIRVDVNGTENTYDPKQFTDVQVQGDGGQDTLHVEATVLPTVANGIAVMNVGDQTGVQDIVAPLSATVTVTVTLNVDDTGDTQARHVTVHTPEGYGHEVISGLAPADISLNFLPLPIVTNADAQTSPVGPVVTLITGSAADQVDVKGTLAITLPAIHTLNPGEGGLLILDSSGGADAVTVGDNGSMANVGGTVRVRNHAGHSNLTIDDSADTASRQVNIQTNNDPASAGVDVSGLSQAIIHYVVPDVSPVTVDGGKVGNTFTVQNLPNAAQVLNLNTGAGQDTVNVFSTSPDAVLNVYTQAGDDTVIVPVFSQLGTVNIDEGESATSDSLVLSVPRPVIDPPDILPGTGPTAVLTRGRAIPEGGTGVINYQRVEALQLEGGGNFRADENLGPLLLTVFGNPPPARQAGFGITTSLETTAPQQLNALNIVGAIVTATPKGGSIDTDALSIFAGKLDLTTDSLRVHYADIDPFQQVRSDVLNQSLVSSAADAHHNLGYADSADKVVKGLSDKTVLVEYTLYGDANLDGRVNFTDLLLLAQNYGKKDNANWDQGDFNYDGKVNFADLLLLAQNYGGSLTSISSTRKRP